VDTTLCVKRELIKVKMLAFSCLIRIATEKTPRLHLTICCVVFAVLVCCVSANTQHIKTNHTANTASIAWRTRRHPFLASWSH